MCPAPEGHRAPQPPWVVELPLLPGLRTRLGLPGMRRRAGAPSGSRAHLMPSLRSCRGGSGALRQLRLPVCRAPRRRHGAPRARPARGGGPAARLSAGLRHRHGSRRRRHCPRPLRRSPAGVLVGTQMVAKGHDFPAVTLGVVVDADATLRFPDFRAEERTFALIAQLAGRSGRGPAGGRVLVQALDVEARALRCAAAHDAEGFVTGELARREALGYPPFTDLIRVVCSSTEAGVETEAAEAVLGALDEELPAARRARPPTARPCSGRRRCFASRAATVPRWCSNRPTGRPQSPRFACPSRGSRAIARGVRSASRWTWTHSKLKGCRRRPKSHTRRRSRSLSSTPSSRCAAPRRCHSCAASATQS